MTDNTPNMRGFKIENNAVLGCNGVGLKNLLSAGTHWLEAHLGHVNRINVFPVPDGDTGTNMLLTMRSAVEGAGRAAGHSVGDVATAAAHGALMSARGNSGVILSQYLQGVATALCGRVYFNTDDFARAAQLGTQLAYQSVAAPVEGTILTVAQAISQAAAAGAQSTPDLTAQLARVVEAARQAQASTPDLLPVLKQAGVTDSGGLGLLVIFEGWLRYMQHQPVDSAPRGVSSVAPRLPAADNYGFDVQFLITGNGLNVPEIRNRISQLGGSTVVVGSERVVKVHLHTHNPDAPLSYAGNLGTISDVVVENLSAQAREFLTGVQPVATTTVGTVLVAPGPGFETIFRSLGADAVITAQTAMNPNAPEWRQVIEQITHENVLIFPNNGKLILALQQLAKTWPKNVHVAPSRSAPQGIAGLVAFDPHLNLQENAARAADAAGRVTTIEIAGAANGTVTAWIDRQTAVTGQNTTAVVLDILAEIKNDQHELLSIYFGAAASQQLADALGGAIKQHHAALEIEIYNGGQPHHNYIISLE